jgi:hypothetical protein
VLGELAADEQQADRAAGGGDRVDQARRFGGNVKQAVRVLNAMGEPPS